MSNSAKGEEFVNRVAEYLAQQGHTLKPEYSVMVGLNSRVKKAHRFDLGSPTMLVECKHYNWTEGGNNPSAKISTLNEAMMYFHATPGSFRKLAFISATTKKGARNPETFAEYYVRLHAHFIPDGVEVWELDSHAATARLITSH